MAISSSRSVMYAPSARSPSASAATRSSVSATRCARISFTRIGVPFSCRPQPVAGAADRLDGLDAERAIELVAEAPDVDVDDVRVVLIAGVPSALKLLVARGDGCGL